MRLAFTDGAYPANAFRTRCCRKGRAYAVVAAAETDISRVDRKGDDVEHDFLRAGLADIRQINAARNVFRHAIGVKYDPLHFSPRSVIFIHPAMRSRFP